MLVNYHFHDRLSFDASGFLEENILQAIEHGITHFGISNHGETYGWKMDPKEMIERFSKGKQEFLELQKKYPQLKMSYGYEATVFPTVFLAHEELQSAVEFDFVIGSTHWIDGEFVDVLMPQMPMKKLITEYFRTMIQGLEWGKFTQLGHLDFFARYTPVFYEEQWNWQEFSPFLKDIAALVKEKNIVMELNCAGLFYAGKQTNPTEEIVSFFVEQGARKWTLGSDSHKPSDFAKGLDTGLALLKKYNITPHIY